ncbi:MAG: GNAT family N-acetyltransferase [Rubrobacteraceae bacterium]
MTLGDDTVVVVREVRPEDAPALRRLVGRLGERSVYLRYFSPMRELSEKQAQRFAEVDGRDRLALVALDPDAPREVVAVVRYERRKNDRDKAEYAAVVEDRFQGLGLGSGMTRVLIRAALRRDVRRLDALVLHENTAMLHLLKSLGLPEKTRWEDGVEHVEVDLSSDTA